MPVMPTYDPDILNRKISQQLQIEGQQQALQNQQFQQALQQQSLPFQRQQQQLEIQKMQRELSPEYRQQLLNDKLAEIRATGEAQSQFRQKFIPVPTAQGILLMHSQTGQLFNPDMSPYNQGAGATGATGAPGPMPTPLTSPHKQFYKVLGSDGQLHLHDALTGEDKGVADQVLGKIVASEGGFELVDPRLSQSPAPSGQGGPLAGFGAPQATPITTPKGGPLMPLNKGAMETAKSLSSEVDRNKTLQAQNSLEQNINEIRQSVAMLDDPNVTDKSGIAQAIKDQYNKILVPNSIVRQGAYAATGDGQSILNQIKTKIGSLIDSQGISSTQAHSLLNLSEDFVRGGRQRALQELSTIRKRGEAYGVPEEQYVPVWAQNIPSVPSQAQGGPSSPLSANDAAVLQRLMAKHR